MAQNISKETSRWVVLGGISLALLSPLLFGGAVVGAAEGRAAKESAPDNTYETRLKNGLRVIVREDRRAPTVVHMLWYRVGSMDEVDGRSGLAHVLEHMMFKGTPSIPAGEFSKRVAAAGGRDNAFTSRDYTAYFQQIPNQKLAEMMSLESDRMRHLTIDAKEFAQELKVVQEERRQRTDDNPDAKLFEQMNAEAFLAHPYRRPIIGWAGDLRQMKSVDVKSWYDTWYAPNNAYLVVVGDVEHKRVFRLAARYYGKIKRKKLPERRFSPEPQQEGERRIVVKAPAELPSIILAYKAPSIKDPTERDPYALEMLAAVLDGHDAARFNRNLVREQRVALEAWASYRSMSRGPGMFYLSGTPGAGKTPADLEAALKGEIEKIKTSGVSEAELSRARAQLLASEIYKLDSLFGQAMEIGGAEATGLHWKKIPQLIAGLKATSRAEIQAVARKYFTDDTLTVGVLDPQPLDKKARKTSDSAKSLRH